MELVLTIFTWVPFGILTSDLLKLDAFTQLYAHFYFKGENIWFPLKKNNFPFILFYLWVVFGGLSILNLILIIMKGC